MDCINQTSFKVTAHGVVDGSVCCTVSAGEGVSSVKEEFGNPSCDEEGERTGR